MIPGYSLRTSPSILSPVQMMVLGLEFPVGFESQRTVMAAVTRAVRRTFCTPIVTSLTFRLTIRTQKWGVAEYAVILALHVT